MHNVIIGTDGGSRGNGQLGSYGAYGAVLKWGEKVLELGEAFDNVTNNQMELLGVIVALEKLGCPCNVNLYSDSSYVCNAVAKGWIDNWKSNGWKTKSKKDVANKELWERLLPLLHKHNVEFIWVKGHNNHPLNERCDKIANIKMDEFKAKYR